MPQRVFSIPPRGCRTTLPTTPSPFLLLVYVIKSFYPFTFDAHGTSSVLVIKPSELPLLGPAACLLGQLLTFMLFQPGLR